MSGIEELTNEVRKAVLAYGPEDPVSPEIISDAVIRGIDPDDDAPTLVRWGCILELRQIARGVLRRTYDGEPGQDGLFDDDLPEKMPGYGDHKGLYVPRSQMTLTDYEGNIDRYEKELESKQRKLDKLRAEFEAKRDAGLFSEAA